MAQVPSNLIPTRLSQLPEDPAPSGDGWLMYVRDGVTYKTQASTLLDVSGVPPTRAVIAGTGLTGGGALSSDVTLSVAPHGIGSSELSNTGVTAGVYGSATSTGQFTVGEDGRVTSAVEVTSTPDMAQATGVLGLTNGGSGRSLVATPGAFVYTDGGGMQVMPQGGLGQVPVSTVNGAPVWGSVLTQSPMPPNVVHAGPVSGPDALTTFRSLVNADLPVVDVAHGGTNATNATSARANLSAAVLGANNDITSLSGVTGGVSTVDYVDFDTAAPGVRATGRLWWDSADGVQTLNLGMAGSNATLQVGEESFFRIKATTAINEADVVMFTGSVGASAALTGAPATGLTPATAQLVMGLATEDIALNGWGYVTEFGLVRGINTTGSSVGEVWADGDILYYNPAVTGGLTKTIPVAPNAKVVVAAVVHVSVSQGSLFVRPSFGGVLGQYEGDVNLTGLANGQLLVRDQTAGVWKNATLTDGTGVSVTEGAGSVTVGLATAYGDSLNPYASKTANYFLAAPNGSAGVPSFRAVVAADIPTLNQDTTGTSSNVTGIVAVLNGGTGATTAADARTNLGASTLGSNVFTITNPSAVTFPRFNADNTVSALDAATFRTAIGAGTSSTAGTVTDVAALTLGTTGTDLTSTVVNGATTPVITLNVPTASAANRGALSSTDWSTFNSKQVALVSGTNIKTVGGVSLLGAGDVGTLGTAYGGTNSTATPAAGGVAYGSGSAILVTAAGTAGQVLTSTGAGAPAWGGISGGTF